MPKPLLVKVKRPYKKTRYDRSQDRRISRMWKQMKPEEKFYTFGISGSINNTGTLSILTDMAQGIDNAERLGTLQHGKRLKFNYYWNVGAMPSYGNVRFIIFRYREDNKVNPASMAGLLSGSDPTTAIQNPLFRSQYHILYDKRHGLTVGNNSTVNGGHSIDLSKLPNSLYDSTTAADATTNHIYALAVSDTAGANPNFKADFIYYYTDN